MSGHPRNVASLSEVHRATLHRLRQLHQVDLYISTWDAGDPHGDDREPARQRRALDELGAAALEVSTPPVIDEDHLLALGLEEPKEAARRRSNIASMWAGIQRSFALAEEGGEYDLFVRTRPDVLCNLRAEVEQVVKLGSGRPHFPLRAGLARTPSDLVFISPAACAKPIFNLIDTVPAWAADFQATGYRLLIPEQALGFHLSHLGQEWNSFRDTVILARETSDWYFHQEPRVLAHQTANEYLIEMRGRETHPSVLVTALRIPTPGEVHSVSRAAAALLCGDVRSPSRLAPDSQAFLASLAVRRLQGGELSWGQAAVLGLGTAIIRRLIPALLLEHLLKVRAQVVYGRFSPGWGRRAKRSADENHPHHQ